LYGNHKITSLDLFCCERSNSGWINSDEKCGFTHVPIYNSSCSIIIKETFAFAHVFIPRNLAFGASVPYKNCIRFLNEAFGNFDVHSCWYCPERKEAYLDVGPIVSSVPITFLVLGCVSIIASLIQISRVVRL